MKNNLNMNNFDFIYNLLIEGIKSGYKHGNLPKNEINERLPLSNDFCTKILKNSYRLISLSMQCPLKKCMNYMV